MRPRRADETHQAHVLAKQQAPSGQELRMVVYEDWYALALYASRDAFSHRSLVSVDGVWTLRGGGGGGGGPPRRLTAGTGAGWSTPIRDRGACATVIVYGIAGDDVEHVQVEFDDGHIEDAVVGDGVHAWFYARRPPPRRPPSGDHYVRELLGSEPITVIGLGSNGREVARQALRAPVQHR